VNATHAPTLSGRKVSAGISPEWIVCALTILVAALCTATTAAGQTRRAVLVGINIYEPKTAAPPAPAKATKHGEPATAKEARGPLPPLDGPINDIRDLRLILIKRYNFDPKNIHMLRGSQATRASILTAIDTYLLKEAAPGDVSLFVFAGHGSRRKNSLSTKSEFLDSTFVPADSYLGVDDIRDKEIARVFNQILRKKVTLTAIFDSCHSGGIARGLPEKTKKVRFLAYDPRDAKDEGEKGSKPGDNGAIILSAAQPDELAAETTIAPEAHGAFTWALMNALNTLATDAPADDVFRRVTALMTLEQPPVQHPALDGPGDRPLFGAMPRSPGRLTLLVQSVNDYGTFDLDGGLALRLGVGSELVKKGAPDVRIRLIRVEALSTSTGQLINGDASTVKEGDAFELDRWVVPAEARLRVWIPKGLSDEQLAEAATELAKLRLSDRIEWVVDPIWNSPSHLLEWGESGWTLRSPNGKSDPLGAQLTAERVLALLRAEGAEKPKLFAYVPPSAELVNELKLGEGTDNSAVGRVKIGDAQYVLVGRLGEKQMEYAWLQPNSVKDPKLPATAQDLEEGTFCSPSSPLPMRTNWIKPGPNKESLQSAARELERLSMQLGRISALYALNPGGSDGEFAYRLALMNRKTKALVREGPITEGDDIGFALVADPEKLGATLKPQWVYIFSLTCTGQAQLWFPSRRQGNAANHLPTKPPDGGPWRAQIPLLADEQAFIVDKPFGMDTYFLVTSTEPVADLGVFEFEPVVAAGSRGGANSVADILSELGSNALSRGNPPSTDWSIQRLPIPSVRKTPVAATPEKK